MGWSQRDLCRAYAAGMGRDDIPSCGFGGHGVRKYPLGLGRPPGGPQGGGRCAALNERDIPCLEEHGCFLCLCALRRPSNASGIAISAGAGRCSGSFSRLPGSPPGWWKRPLPFCDALSSISPIQDPQMTGHFPLHRPDARRPGLRPFRRSADLHGRHFPGNSR
mgnify:CR=1 FL=1